MLRRDNRQERREDRRAGRGPGDGGSNRYQMRQNLVSIGDDFWITNAAGEKVYKVDGKALRVRDTLRIDDRDGNELANMQARIARVRDTMKVGGPHGETLATVQKAMITPVRERWTVKIGDGPDINIQGNLLDHEYTIEAGGKRIAEVSKRWFRVRDSYGVEIEPGQNDLIILAATVAIDLMTHN